MKIEEILSKVVKGSDLSESEKSFLSDYKTGIPKERLDKEISKKKDAEDKVNSLEKKVGELADLIKAKDTQLDDDKTASLTEQEKMQKLLDDKMADFDSKILALEEAKTQAETKLAEKEFNLAVNDIAKSNKFVDSNYLAYMLKSNEVDINDKDALGEFINATKESNPAMFKIDNAGGSGSTSTSKEPTREEQRDIYKKAKESGDIESMLANAPTIE